MYKAFDCQICRLLSRSEAVNGEGSWHKPKWQITLVLVSLLSLEAQSVDNVSSDLLVPSYRDFSNFQCKMYTSFLWISGMELQVDLSLKDPFAFLGDFSI